MSLTHSKAYWWIHYWDSIEWRHRPIVAVSTRVVQVAARRCSAIPQFLQSHNHSIDLPFIAHKSKLDNKSFWPRIFWVDMSTRPLTLTNFIIIKRSVETNSLNHSKGAWGRWSCYVHDFNDSSVNRDLIIKSSRTKESEGCLKIALSRMKEWNLIKFHPNFYVYLQSVLLGKYQPRQQ